MTNESEVTTVIGSQRIRASKYQGHYIGTLEELDNKRNQLCKEHHVAVRIDIQADWFPMADWFEVYCPDSQFFTQSQPDIDHYTWFSACWIGFNGTHQGIIVCTPWIWPQDTRSTLILLVGEPSEELVEGIVGQYVERVKALIEGA